MMSSSSQLSITPSVTPPSSPEIDFNPPPILIRSAEVRAAFLSLHSDSDVPLYDSEDDGTHPIPESHLSHRAPQPAQEGSAVSTRTRSSSLASPPSKSPAPVGQSSPPFVTCPPTASCRDPPTSTLRGQTPQELPQDLGRATTPPRRSLRLACLASVSQSLPQ